mmetsp:Transcript_37873/g.88538  ORF Transcript_37873/g.88538 Transcript_37873/m.88538 type:complete len:85 (+) Transcript_37873:796-1050(+)
MRNRMPMFARRMDLTMLRGAIPDEVSPTAPDVAVAEANMAAALSVKSCSAAEHADDAVVILRAGGGERPGLGLALESAEAAELC